MDPASARRRSDVHCTGRVAKRPCYDQDSQRHQPVTEAMTAILLVTRRRLALAGGKKKGAASNLEAP
jgi:hypothetical protein